MLERLKLTIELVAPIGGMVIGGWWALHTWGKSSVLVWWVVPIGVVGFNLWWHWRWRCRLATRVVALNKGVAHSKPPTSDISRNATGAP